MFAALIAPTSFRGREIAIVVLNALMGLPPASRRGFEPGPNPDRETHPLGSCGAAE
jgi:hypothetical protein